MTVKTSTFTSEALELFAQWQVDPSKAKKFTQIAFGTLTDEQAESTSLYADPDITEMHAADSSGVVAYFNGTDDITIIAGDDPSVALVKTNITFDSASSMRGHTVREVGLYVNIAESGSSVANYRLVWIGRFPDSYIPLQSESGVDVTLNVTVPVKFNSDAIPGQILTDNASLAQQINNIETELGKLEDDIDSLDYCTLHQYWRKAPTASGWPGVSFMAITPYALQYNKDPDIPVLSTTVVGLSDVEDFAHNIETPSTFFIVGKVDRATGDDAPLDFSTMAAHSCIKISISLSIYLYNFSTSIHHKHYYTHVSCDFLVFKNGTSSTDYVMFPLQSSGEFKNEFSIVKVMSTGEWRGLPEGVYFGVSWKNDEYLAPASIYDMNYTAGRAKLMKLAKVKGHSYSG